MKQVLTDVRRVQDFASVWLNELCRLYEPAKARLSERPAPNIFRWRMWKYKIVPLQTSPRLLFCPLQGCTYAMAENSETNSNIH